MANLKAIRKRISSVKSTQKITRAQKMVAGARLTRAQHRIQALRPYAVKTAQVLAEVAGSGTEDEGAASDHAHPLLARRAEKTVLLLVITSDRGLCGAFNTNILRAATRIWQEREAAGQSVKIITIGRKGRDYFKRRNAPVLEAITGVWERLDMEQARSVARKVLAPFVKGEVDSIYLVYNEFKSVIQQRVIVERLLPIERKPITPQEPGLDYLYEPGPEKIYAEMLPKHVEIQVWRALLESAAAEHGARMAAMDAATRNAGDMIDRLTLYLNKVRQAAITKEIIEVVSGAGS